MNTISVASLNNRGNYNVRLKCKLFLGLNESAAKGLQRRSYKISLCQKPNGSR